MKKYGHSALLAITKVVRAAGGLLSAAIALLILMSSHPSHNQVLPSVWTNEGLWSTVGFITAASGCLLIFAFSWGDDLVRATRLVARVCGWEAAVGAVLLFSVALESVDTAVVDGSAAVGLLLLSPAIVGMVAHLLSDAWESRGRQCGHQVTGEETSPVVAIAKRRGWNNVGAVGTVAALSLAMIVGWGVRRGARRRHL